MDRPASSPAPSRAGLVGLAAVVAVAAVLRFAHLGAGLPAVVDVDAFKFVRAAQAMVAGEAVPRDFQYPDLYPRLVAAVLALVPDRTEATAHLVARGVSAVAGVGLVPIVFLLARRLGGDGAGLVAAALVAVSPATVTASRTAATDSLLVLAMAVGLLVATRPGFAEGRRGLAWAALGGVALGAAVGSKWTGLVLAPALAAPLALLAWRRRWRQAAGGAAVVAAVATATLLATTATLVAEGPRYLARFRHELRIAHHGQIGRVQAGWSDLFVGDTPTWEQPWLGTSLLADGGPLVLAAGLAGLGLGLAGRAGFAGFVHAAFVAGYLSTIAGPGRLLAMRFLLPLLPSFLVLAALAAATLAARSRRRWVLPALALALVAVPAVRAASSGVFVRGEPTTLELAGRFLAEHVQPGEGVFLAPFFLAPLAAGLERPLGLPGIAARQYRLPGDPAHNAELAPIYAPELLEALRRQGARWVVSAAPFDAAFSPVAGNLRWFPRATAAYAAWRERLAAEGERALVLEALPRAPRRGPEVEIWHLRPLLGPPSSSSAPPPSLGEPGATR